MPGWPMHTENGSQHSPQNGVVPYVAEGHPPPAKERRIRLTTIGEIRKEMAKVYREARNGQIDTVQAGRFTYMLREIAVLIRDHQIEARLEALEKGREE